MNLELVASQGEFLRRKAVLVVAGSRFVAGRFDYVVTYSRSIERQIEFVAAVVSYLPIKLECEEACVG